jgi:hypothetical protein
MNAGKKIASEMIDDSWFIYLFFSFRERLVSQKDHSAVETSLWRA